MKYISLNWTLALKFSIGKKKRMRDCRILMAHDCITVTGIRQTLIRAEKSVERKMTPVTQKWCLSNDRYTFCSKLIPPYHTLR